MTTTTRRRLHQLVDDLPDTELHTAERFLEFLGVTPEKSPAWEASANAPEDDEPVTDEDRDAIREGLAELAAGEGLTSDEVRQQLRGTS